MARTTVATDNFNRASLGSDWTQLNPALAGNIQIDSSTRIHAAYTFVSAGSTAAARWNGAGSFSNDQFGSVKITAISGSGNNHKMGATARAGSGIDGSRAWYEFSMTGLPSGPTYTTELVLQNGGTRTVLATGSLAWSVGDTIDIEVEGSTIRGCQNGTPLGGSWTVTDTTLTTGKPGVVASGTTQLFGDDWVGGNVTAADTTAPTLTSPTGTKTGSTTASGTVSTDEANGTLYRYASTNATESAATVKAAALTTTVTATGSQAVTFTGLTPNTTYYAHYVHTDAAANDSTRVSSASFTTDPSGDTTAPVLTSPTGTKTGSTTASGTVSTDEGNGTLYRLASTNATESAATVKAAALTTTISSTGSKSVSFTGLTPATTYYAHYVHRDSSGNDSTRVSSASFTTDAAAPAPAPAAPTGVRPIILAIDRDGRVSLLP
jgi:hypothetical protein